MSLSKQIGPEFQAFDFTHDRRMYEVLRGGSGPAVLVFHEIPGLHPGVIDFARRLIVAGYTVYLRALAASAYRECGGPGVGVVGMCFTGGFALATALEPSVVASVMSQPAMPAPIGERGRAALGLGAEDLATIRARANDDLRVLGLRFTNDRG